MTNRSLRASLLLPALCLLVGLTASSASAALPAWLADADASALVVESSGARLGTCASVKLSERHVTVSQWIDGQVFRWKEIPQADGSLCTFLLAPQVGPLSAAQAAALRDASAGMRVAAAAEAPAAPRAGQTSARTPSRSTVRAGVPAVSEQDRAFDREARRLLGESRAGARARLDRRSSTVLDRGADSASGQRLQQPIVFPPDERVRTADTTVFPYNTVVFVESEFPDGTIAFASGVLISPYTVLTTALALYDPLLGGFAESVLVVPGQNQPSQGANLIEPYGNQFGIEIEVPQSWIDNEDAASSYGAVFLGEAFPGINTFYPIAFDLIPNGNVELIGYDESPQGETESFAQWRRTGTLVASDDLFVDHRMDDDLGAVGAPLATAGSNRRLFAVNCCVSDAGSPGEQTNVAVRLTSDIEGQITGWQQFQPGGNGEPLDGPPIFLNDDRFRVVVNWRDFDGNSGAAQPVGLTDDTGYWTIFDADNVEVVLKVLDACGVNDNYWVFIAGLTNLAIEIEVTDTVTNDVNRYSNPISVDFQPVLDTSAFATCP